MSGTTTGGVKTAATIKAKYGEDFYARAGAKGGANSHVGGFGYDGRTLLEKLLLRPKKGVLLAHRVGAIGGKISRRTKGV